MTISREIYEMICKERPHNKVVDSVNDYIIYHPVGSKLYIEHISKVSLGMIKDETHIKNYMILSLKDVYRQIKNDIIENFISENSKYRIHGKKVILTTLVEPDTKYLLMHPLMYNDILRRGIYL